MDIDCKIEVLPFGKIDHQEWHSFLADSSESTYFCTSDHWLNFKEAYLLQVRDEKNSLVAGIPFRTLSIINIFARFFQMCRSDSSVIVREDLIENEVIKLKRLALLSLFKFLEERGVIFFFISPMTRSHDGPLFEELGFRKENAATFLFDVTIDDPDIFRSLSRGHKSAVRTAERLGVNVKIFEGTDAVEYIPEYLRLQKILFKNKKGSYSRIYYKSGKYLNDILSSKSAKSYIAIAYYEDKPAAASILLSYKRLLYYFNGASDFELTRISKAATLLHYEIIKYAKKDGFQRYDFGGIPFSTDPSIKTNGVYEFKKRFGGERYEYDIGNFVFCKNRYQLLMKLQKYQDHPISRVVYSWLKSKN